MPNTFVRAVAEGMPEIDRRLLLGLMAAFTAAAAVTVASHAHASAGSTDLQDVIAACQSAESTYFECAARENAIAEALGDKLFLKWSPSGGLMSIWSHIPQAVPFVGRTGSRDSPQIASSGGLVGL